MKDNRITKLVYSSNAHGKRPSKHSSKWEENIKEALMKRYVTLINRSRIASHGKLGKNHFENMNSIHRKV